MLKRIRASLPYQLGKLSRTLRVAYCRAVKAAIVAQDKLSKRTLAYASLERKFGDLDDFATDKSNVTVFGLRHAF